MIAYLAAVTIERLCLNPRLSWLPSQPLIFVLPFGMSSPCFFPNRSSLFIWEGGSYRWINWA